MEVLQVGVVEIVVGFIAGVAYFSVTAAVKAAWLVHTAVHAGSCRVVMTISAGLALERVHLGGVAKAA